MKLRVVERRHHGGSSYVIQCRKWYQLWWRDCTTRIGKYDKVMRFRTRAAAQAIIDYDVDRE